MRLAGTINHPTPKKRERGYVAELVTLQVRKDAPAYTIDHLIGLLGNEGKPNDPFGFSTKLGRDDSELKALLEASRVPGQWHISMRGAIATMIGRGWSDLQIKLACALYCQGGADDPDLVPLIEGARTKWNRPNEESVAGDFSSGGNAAVAVFDPWQRYIVPEFPVDVLPSEAQDFVCAQSEVIGCDASGLAMSVLATFSGALHHEFKLRMLRHGSWWVSPRLWVLLIGMPSYKKTPIFNAATQPLQDYGNELWEKHELEMRLYEKAQEAKDGSVPEPAKPPRYVVWDTTVEKLGEILAHCDGKGILVKSDEIAGWLASMERYSSSLGRSDRAFWLQAYDGGPYVVDRIKRGTVRIKNLSASVVGGIQPERLAEIRAGLNSDGLLQRFLPIMLRAPGFRLYMTLVRQLIFARPERLIMSDEVLAVMEGLHKHLHDLEQVSSGLAAGFDSFVGKLLGVCGNLALILHMAHDPKLGATYAVEEDTVQAVRRLMLDFILPHALEFYRGSEETAGDRLRRIASWILTSGATRVLASDLARSVRDCRGISLWELNKRVAPLVACGWLAPADQTPVCNSWQVNPQVHAQLAERAKAEEASKATLAALMGSPRQAAR